MKVLMVSLITAMIGIQANASCGDRAGGTLERPRAVAYDHLLETKGKALPVRATPGAATAGADTVSNPRPK